MAAASGTRNPSVEVLEDLVVRFVVTLPESELESFERLLFSIEQAWWYFEDVVRELPENQNLRSLPFKEFTGLIFRHTPGLENCEERVDEIFEQFNEYKRSVPVRGAILLNPAMDKCLLVRGWKKDAGWGFPRGKLAAGETDAECAVREVLEETGLDIAGRLREQDCIDAQLGDQDTRLFIVPDVPEATHFAPHVRYEIGAFAWHIVQHLPATYAESKQAFVNEAGGRHKFYNVWPYIRPLRAWIDRRRQGKKGSKKAQAAATATAPVIPAPPKLTLPAPLPPAGKAGPAATPGPAAAAAAAAEYPPVPGRALLDFKFDVRKIEQVLLAAHVGMIGSVIQFALC